MSRFNIIDLFFIILITSYSFRGFRTFDKTYSWNKRYVRANRLGYGGLFISSMMFIFLYHLAASADLPANSMIIGLGICGCMLLCFLWFILDGYIIKRELDYKFKGIELGLKYKDCKNYKKILIVLDMMAAFILIIGLFILQ